MNPRLNIYLLNLATAKDQYWNAKYSPVLNLIYKTDLFGNEDETLSSVFGKMQKAGKDTRTRKVIDWVFLKLAGQVNHCLNHIEADEGKNEKCPEA